MHGCLAGLQALLALAVLPISVVLVTTGDEQAWWGVVVSAGYLLYCSVSLLLGRRPNWFI